MKTKHISIFVFRNFCRTSATFFAVKPIAFNLLSLSLVAALIISATVNADAVCQTPQFGLPIVLNVTRPVAAAAGDFNGDNKIDVAVLKIVTGAFPGVVEVFLGDGNGGFASTGTQYNAVTQGSQILVYDLAAADFNNDGRLDLVATGSSPAIAAILLGNGNGGFGSPTNFNSANNATSVAVGDFNNDNKIDLVTRGFSGASVLPGSGNGSFGAAVVVPLASGASTKIEVRDFNADGFLDFTTANPSAGGASVRLGNGSFIFSDPSSVTNFNAYETAVNDFNRDGKPDIAIVNRGSASTLSINLGSGSGTFSPASGSPFSFNGSFSEFITSADFNSDNIPDVAIGNTAANNTLSILLNNGSGVFGTAFNLSPEQGASGRIYPVDFNKNGVTDLIIVKEEAQNKVVALPNLCAPSGRAKFDFDGDGKSDVSVYRPSNGNWYLLQSTAGFTNSAFGLSTDKLVPADYDGDGKTDIAVYRSGTWYLNRSTAGFAGITFGDGNDVPQPADYDGDGKAELAFFRPSNGYWYFMNLANNQTSFVPFGANIDKPVAADYDGDGKTDIAVFRNGVWYLLRSQLGYAGVIFGDSTDKPVPGDYDGDAKADFAVFRPSNGTWYLQRSQLGFAGIQFGLGTDAPTAADYDGDGKTDIAVFRNGNWYLNRTTAGFTSVAFGTSDDKAIPNAFIP